MALRAGSAIGATILRRCSTTPCTRACWLGGTPNRVHSGPSRDGCAVLPEDAILDRITAQRLEHRKRRRFRLTPVAASAPAEPPCRVGATNQEPGNTATQDCTANGNNHDHRDDDDSNTGLHNEENDCAFNGLGSIRGCTNLARGPGCLPDGATGTARGDGKCSSTTGGDGGCSSTAGSDGGCSSTTGTTRGDDGSSSATATARGDSECSSATGTARGDGGCSSTTSSARKMVQRRDLSDNSAPQNATTTATATPSLSEPLPKRACAESPSVPNPPPPPMSTTAVGRAYELRAQRVLAELGLDLEHTGQAGDGGVDLRGKWAFPDGRHVRVVGQCKHEAKRLGPSVVRDFEGALMHEGLSNALGLIISKSGFSQRAQQHALASPCAMILCTLTGSTHVSSWRFNRRAQALAPGVSVGASYTRNRTKVPRLTYAMEDGSFCSLEVSRKME